MIKKLKSELEQDCWARIVYGANCTWWDSISKASQLPNGIPCCPFCKSVLFEFPTLAAFMEGAEKYEADGHPGYRELLTWQRGKCFRTMEDAKKRMESAKNLCECDFAEFPHEHGG